MDAGYITHPNNAREAKDFTAPASLSFPGGAGHLTPPNSEKDQSQQAGSRPAQNGAPQPGNTVSPATPAATPGAGQGVSGIVPTLQVCQGVKSTSSPAPLVADSTSRTSWRP